MGLDPRGVSGLRAGQEAGLGRVHEWQRCRANEHVVDHGRVDRRGEAGGA